MGLLLAASGDVLLTAGGDRLLLPGSLSPVSTSITINYTGWRYLPELTVAGIYPDAEVELLYASGTATVGVDLIHVYLNGSVFPAWQFAPVDGEWSTPIGPLRLGANTIRILAFNYARDYRTEYNYTVTYALPVANGFKRVVPLVMGADGLRVSWPRVVVDGVAVPVKCWVGTYSNTAQIENGVECVGSLGTFDPQRPSNSVALTGAAAVAALGSFTVFSSSTLYLVGSEVAGGFGTIVPVVPVLAYITTGVEAAGAIGTVDGYYTVTESCGGALALTHADGWLARRPTSGSWSPPSGQNIEAVHVVGSVPTGFFGVTLDHYRIYTQAGVHFASVAGYNIDYWIAAPAGTTGIYMVLYTDSQNGSGYLEITEVRYLTT